ncbi:hypothetical protein, unlikely [Trypanosoma brucei gambiense DAL972]|uniref:Uncharacterized protein n=1 Tax=Trypanosoma brucei gambiense (strain MHOM/CI/86/DAL972) TaxID=679716 RepID=D0A2M8_TRYB9|nr:hypothetical protein, unlikely [Trypanosoma brucei gambiense DAL972]CBH15522.1 hypothetical protein, unlikely [Trypanosoma brucei gambiense DAL972]|eukprot:XP_011777786.1 hypothetical protein, unlikely [Trypanosoma brucei gambiense DAL972]
MQMATASICYYSFYTYSVVSVANFDFSEDYQHVACMHTFWWHRSPCSCSHSTALKRIKAQIPDATSKHDSFFFTTSEQCTRIPVKQFCKPPNSSWRTTNLKPTREKMFHHKKNLYPSKNLP